MSQQRSVLEGVSTFDPPVHVGDWEFHRIQTLLRGYHRVAWKSLNPPPGKDCRIISIAREPTQKIFPVHESFREARYSIMAMLFRDVGMGDDALRTEIVGIDASGRAIASLVYDETDESAEALDCESAVAAVQTSLREEIASMTLFDETTAASTIASK